MASFSLAKDERDCTIQISAKLRQAVMGSRNRKNLSVFAEKPDDTVRDVQHHLYSQNVTPALADQVIDLVQKIMSTYQVEGFTVLTPENGYKVNVVIEPGSGDPVYSPSNGTVHIPQDSMGKDNLASELAHELGLYRVQDVAL